MIASLRRRHGAAFLVASALACSSGGGAPPADTPTPTAAPADAPPVTVALGTAPSFVGVATGNGWVDGSATAAASTRYFREVSGARGQVFELRGDASGDEKDKACGTDWRASVARSAVLVTPDATAGSVGFTLNATATAQRGMWRTKATLSCTTINRTEAQAATMARGQAWMTLGGGFADVDQLVIETSGSTSGEWALSVTDSAGQKYPITQIGSTLVAPVPGAGRYSVAASVTARAATSGTTRDSVDQRLRAAVKVSSLRNALAVAMARPPLPSLDVPVTVDEPAAALADPMNVALAGYQPCAAKPGCAGKVSDLSASSASVWASGGGTVVEFTLTGKKRTPAIVRLVGAVSVTGDSLRLVDLRLAADQPHISRKKDLSAAVALFAARLDGVTASLAPRLGAAESALRARFPVRVGDLCVEAPAAAPRFLGTTAAADSTTFRAYFGLTPSPLQPCGRPR